MSKVGGFIAKLAEGKGVCTDPFDDDFFDVAEHLARREVEEPAIVEEQMQRAKRRGEILEKLQQQAKYRERARE